MNNTIIINKQSQFSFYLEFTATNADSITNTSHIITESTNSASTSIDTTGNLYQKTSYLTVKGIYII